MFDLYGLSICNPNHERRVFHRSRSPRKNRSPINMLPGRRKTRNNGKNVSPLSSFKLQRGYYPPAKDSYEEDGSENFSSEASSCNAGCNACIDDEGMDTNSKSGPCWECRECSLFQSGESPHVTELYATSNNDIEKLKFCLQNIEFSHSASEYKVFIIEDCHELSHEAFSTLLKFVENPNSYMVFILITIDSKLLPKPFLSGCQKFRFQKLKDVDMFSRLHRLAISENIDIEEDALRLITFKAEGSLRDAENTLEQFSLLPAKVTLTIVLQTIGLIPHEKLVELLDFSLAADTENTMRTAREIIDSGIQPLTLVSQLATLITDILASGCIPAPTKIAELKPATKNQLPGMADAAKGK